MEELTDLDERLISTNSAAELLDMSVEALRRRVRAKTVPFRDIGETDRPVLRFYKSELLAFINGARLLPIPNGVTIRKGKKT